MDQPLQTGYFHGSFRSALDDSIQPFALWVPTHYSARKQYALIVALHGMDADERMIPESCLEIHSRGFRDDCILLSVFGRGDLGYEGPGEADLWEAVNWVRHHYRINPHRLYLTGLSMGGYATWRLACDYPEQWAAIAPVCGGGDVNALETLKGIPVWCVHGDEDAFVDVDESRRLIAELKRLEYPHRYDELKGWGHNSWEWLYDPDRSHDSLFDWFLHFRKSKPAPLVKRPRRRGGFKDLFNERLVISYPAHTAIPGERDLLRAEAYRIAHYTFGDYVMKRGELLVRADHEISPTDLVDAGHLMLGRSDNHSWLAKVERRLLARHARGTLKVLGENYLGKGLVAATCQTSPWNRDRLLGVITYQQYGQMRGIAERLCGPHVDPLPINIYDAQQRRFILQERAPKS